jgi:hypothetical protein
MFGAVIRLEKVRFATRRAIEKSARREVAPRNQSPPGLPKSFPLARDNADVQNTGTLTLDDLGSVIEIVPVSEERDLSHEPASNSAQIEMVAHRNCFAGAAE